MEIVIAAAVGAVGGIVIEWLRRGRKNNDEVLDELRRLTQKVQDLEDEVVEWQSKYLLLLHQITGSVKP